MCEDKNNQQQSTKHLENASENIRDFEIKTNSINEEVRKADAAGPDVEESIKKNN